MLPYHVALVADESRITLGELSEVAAALQKQVTRDFGPIWGIAADVSAFASLENLPLDYWPIIIRDNIKVDAAGVHLDQNGQPLSLVKYESDWPLTASHELLEMICDPFGRRLIAGTSPVADQGRVQFLVEVCDPCEAENFAYPINGVTVSDFYTPHYFDPVAASGVRYSFNGSITKPLEVRKGGYLSWYMSASGAWWQRTWFEDEPVDREIQLSATNGNLRAAIDRVTAPYRSEAMKGARSLEAARKAGAAGGRAPNFMGRAEILRSAVRGALR